jgi:hypothetical protein
MTRRDLGLLALVLAASASAGCQQPYLVLVPDHQAEPALAGCWELGSYFATDFTRECGEREGRVFICDVEEAIVTGPACLSDSDGRVWVSDIDVNDQLWSTIGWRRCSGDDARRAEALTPCPPP